LSSYGSSESVVCGKEPEMESAKDDTKRGGRTKLTW
jgi:hypothetical protein